MPARYEWNVKLMDGEDIEENYFSSTLKSIGFTPDQIDLEKYCLELVRNNVQVDPNAELELQDKSYAEVYKNYSKALVLPNSTDQQYCIPNRYRLELEQWNKNK